MAVKSTFLEVSETLLVIEDLMSEQQTLGLLWQQIHFKWTLNMRNREVELRLDTVLQTSDNKYISWPQKVERWASRKSKRNSWKQKLQTPSRKCKTCENEEIQYLRTHPNQILNFGLEIQEYFHTEPRCAKGNSRIWTHSPTQHYKISDINIKWPSPRTHNIIPTILKADTSHSCHCTKGLRESVKMRKHLLNGRKDLA